MSSKTWSSVVLLLALAGCAPSNPGIQIEALLFRGECSFAASAMPATAALPQLDTAPGIRPEIVYDAPLQLANRMLNLASSVYPIMADPNTFYIEEAEVELTAIDGSGLDLAGLPSRFRVPAFGQVPSAADQEPGRGITMVRVVPAVYGDALTEREGTILVNVRVRGTTSGDSTQTTGEFTFPLELCNGCLFRCEVVEGEPVRQISCSPGQDQPSFLPELCR